MPHDKRAMTVTSADYTREEKLAWLRDALLSDEERAKGFVRPVRRSYVHIGQRACGKPKKLEGRPGDYVCSDDPGHAGECTSWMPAPMTDVGVRRLVERSLLGGCDGLTTMAQAIAETYARDPGFYGATYCCTCMKHLPVSEFRWEDGSEVGS